MNIQLFLNKLLFSYYIIYSKKLPFHMIHHSVILEQENECKLKNKSSKSIQKNGNSKDLKNIMELTEQNEVNSQINKDDTDLIDTKPKSCLYRMFNCWLSAWNFLRSSKPQWKYDIDEKDFEFYLNKIKDTHHKIEPVIPPQKEKKKVLILDLDETLIYSTFNKRQRYDFEPEIEVKGKTCKIYTSKRFGLESFLFQMSKIYQLIVFTASEKDYANKVIDLIDPKKRISHRLYRQHCIVINKINFLKNIRILGRKVEDTIIVDDNLLGGILQPDNYYKIESFKGNLKDRQLLRLGDFLKYLSKQQKMTPVQLYRKQFQQMEITLQEKKEQKKLLEASSQKPQNTNFRDLTNLLVQDSNIQPKRKRAFYHQKKNSQVQNLAKQLEEEQAETTATQLMTRL